MNGARSVEGAVRGGSSEENERETAKAAAALSEQRDLYFLYLALER